jgi:hypothetical protein
MKSDLIDIEVFLHYETEKAVLVSDDGDKDKSVWVPKALIELVPSSRYTGPRNKIMTIPERVAIEKGLV